LNNVEDENVCMRENLHMQSVSKQRDIFFYDTSMSYLTPVI